MDYKIIVSPRAQQEIEDTIDFYAFYSQIAPQNFVIEIEKAYHSLEINPFYVIKYKNIRSFRLKHFPYSLYFVINEDNLTVKILSCFHNSLNPNKLPNL